MAEGYSQNLIQKCQQLIEKKTGKKLSIEQAELALNQLANLGLLAIKNFDASKYKLKSNKKAYEENHRSRQKNTNQNYLPQLHAPAENKNRKNRIAWHTDGYFPDLISLSLEYLEASPRRAIKATARFEELLDAIKLSEHKILTSIIKLKE